jgi:hypothetical protein
MPVQPGITIDAREFLRTITVLQKGDPRHDKAVALALVDSAKNARVRARGLIARRTGLKAGTVDGRIYYNTVRPGDAQVVIRSSRRPIRLSEFPGTTQVASGVRTRAWGKSQIIQSAFIKRGQVFRREGRERYPIRSLYGPTIWGTFALREVQEPVGARIREQLPKNLSRRFRAAMRRRS